MTDVPKKLVVCMADHDHANTESCVGKAKEAYIELTPAEIAEQDQMAAEAQARRAQEEIEAQAKADAKLAAQAKLQALGLTGEEIAAITQ